MKQRLFIKNAVIVDGSGCEPCPGGVLIEDGRIAAVGNFGKPLDCETIDADGRVLTPGFIDAHRHADLQALSPSFGAAELCQGITTCVSGNCGMSAAPCPAGREQELYGYLEPCLGRPTERLAFPSFADYTRRLSAAKLPLNMGMFVGNGTVRIAVKGFDPAPMTTVEMERARACIAEAMDAGAMGLSFGLMYSPECNYSMDELVPLAREAGRRGGILTTHIRGEGASLASSVAEVIEVAARAETPLNISHFKAAGRSNWGAALEQAIGLIEAARAKGQDVTCDAYPYDAGSTMLLTVIPPSFLEDGVEPALKELEGKVGRDKLRIELARTHDGWDNLVLDLGWDCVTVSSGEAPENAGCVGRSIREIAMQRHADEVDCLCDILASERGKAGMVIHSMSPSDVERALRLPWCSVISDSIYPPSGNPHPRLHGAFPRVIREFVLEKHALALPEAVRKMTSQPAERLGLRDRGLVKPGAVADILLFRPENVRDAATYENSVQLAQGMDYVFVGRQAAIREGRLQNQRYGTFLERQ